jgi:hypothetical protein
MSGKCTNICNRTAYVPIFIKNRTESENFFLKSWAYLLICLHFKGKGQEIQWDIYRRETCLEKRCNKSRNTSHTQ